MLPFLQVACKNNPHPPHSLVGLAAAFTRFVFALRMLTATLLVVTFAITLLASMMRAIVRLVRMRLGLYEDQEVLSGLLDGMNKAIITIWPLAHKRLLLVIFSKGLLGDFIVKEGCLGGFECGLAGGVCAFDFGALDSANAVVVVVDGCLENCTQE